MVTRHKVRFALSVARFIGSMLLGLAAVWSAHRADRDSRPRRLR